MSVDANLYMMVYVFRCRHVYVYEYDCFMNVHMCTYCICVYVMTVQHCEDTVSVPLALYELDPLLLLVVKHVLIAADSGIGPHYPWSSHSSDLHSGPLVASLVL